MKEKCMICKLEVDLNTPYKAKGFMCISCLFRPQLRPIFQYMADHGIIEFTIRLPTNMQPELEG